MRKMNILDYLIIVVYLVGVVIVGLRCKSKTQTTEEYVVAGRKMG